MPRWCAMMEHFRRSDALDSNEGMSKSDGSGWKSPGHGVLVGSGCSPRVGGGGLRPSSSGSIGGCWRGSGAYERVVRVPERRSGAPELGGQGLLRAGLRAGSGAGHRVGLGYVEKGFSSRAYRGVPSSKIKGARNLTDGLTLDLTTRLTGYLTVGLTE